MNARVLAPCHALKASTGTSDNRPSPLFPAPYFQSLGILQQVHWIGCCVNWLSLGCLNPQVK